MVFGQTAEGSVAPSALGQTKSFSMRGCFFRRSHGFTLFRLTALRLPESELARHREPITEADFRPALAAGKLLDRIPAQTKFPRTPDLTDWRFPGPRYIETCALNQAPPAFVLSALSNRGLVPFFGSVVPPVSPRLPNPVRLICHSRRQADICDVMSTTTGYDYLRLGQSNAMNPLH